MEVARNIILSVWRTVAHLQFNEIFNNIVQNKIFRNVTIFILTVITITYNFFGFIGSLVLTISFLCGIFIPHKLFIVNNHVLPDFTRLFSNDYGSHAHEEPLSEHSKKRLMRQSTSDPGCRICGDTDCVKERSPTHHTKPWEELSIPKNINESLEQLLTKLLDEYVESWYRKISSANLAQLELKQLIKHAASILVHRLRKTNVPDLVIFRLLPICANHLTDVDKFHCDGSYNLRWHPILKNRNSELDYLRSLSEKIIPTLLPTSCTNCHIFSLLLRELLAGWVLLPMSDKASEPAVLNTLLLYLLDMLYPTESPQTYKESESSACDSVEFLDTFSPKPPNKNDLWHPSLETILKKEPLLAAFIQYLKNQKEINILQFCLDVQDFNLRMLEPELSPEDIDMLYKDAWDLYSVYFSPHSPDCIDFDSKLCQELRKILSKDVSKLRTSTPLFEAYDYAYSRLETLHVPNFHNSEEIFTYLCGPKISSSTNTSGLNSPDSVDSPFKKKTVKSSEGPVAKISSKLQKITGVLKPNLVLEGQKDFIDPIEHEVELAESVLEREEERDLSKWGVSICNSKLKADPHFTVRVKRKDRPTDDPDSEWIVQRKIADFYTLESKLKEFHGSFLDVQLPAKKLLTPCPEDSRVYEVYIRKLLNIPRLRASDLLYTFLKSATFEGEQFALGKLFKSVPISLKKERGQNLDPFIRIMVESCKTKTTTKIEWKDIRQEVAPVPQVIKYHSNVFGNHRNEAESEERICEVSFRIDLSDRKLLDTPSKCLLYAGTVLFKLSGALSRLVFVLVTMFQYTLDSLILHYLNKLLSQLITNSNISYIIYLLQWSLFENTTIIDPVEAKVSLENKLDQSSSLLRPLFKRIFFVLQEPILNKQLFYKLLEEILAELFPELLIPVEPESFKNYTNVPSGVDVMDHPLSPNYKPKECEHG